MGKTTRISARCPIVAALIAALVVAVVVLLCAPAYAAPGKRVALVIGAGRYPTAPLANPVNDAQLIGPALQKLGFDVQLVLDPDYDTFKRALRSFGDRLDGATVALFYYAGHGLQVAGDNYLLPVNATLAREADLRYEAFDVQAVLDQMDSPGRINLVFLDACRDNPFSRSLASHMGTRSTVVGHGLAEVDTRVSGTLIAYSTAPGSVALDGSGANSPFTAALARHIADSGLDVRQMLTRVRADVQAATGGKQRPWVNESMDSDFFFAPAAPTVAVPEARRPTVAPPVATEGVTPEIVFWQSIANSSSPADFEAYVQQFPQGVFAPLARARLASLATRSAPPGDAVALPEPDRRAVQTALTGLGQYRGPVDGAASADLSTAIQRWQSFVGLAETGRLSAEQRHRLTTMADLQAALLAVSPTSPRGTPADKVHGAEAQFRTGADFERGAGVPKDPAEAAYWYALAAGQGWPAAFTNLGTLYVRGVRGAAPDIPAARLLWRTAAALGDGTAMFNLGVLAEKGLHSSPDVAAAKRWYARGAERGHQKQRHSLAASGRMRRRLLLGIVAAASLPPARPGVRAQAPDSFESVMPERTAPPVRQPIPPSTQRVPLQPRTTGRASPDERYVPPVPASGPAVMPGVYSGMVERFDRVLHAAAPGRRYVLSVDANRRVGTITVFENNAVLVELSIGGRWTSATEFTGVTQRVGGATGWAADTVTLTFDGGGHVRWHHEDPRFTGNGVLARE